jgi:DUF1365 family protein
VTSAIYTGRVRHRRAGPRAHSVEMGLYLLLLDHEELGRGQLTGSGAPLGPERWWPARYDRRDLLDGDAEVPLDEAVRDLVEARTHRRPRGPVLTLTQVRTFGYVFNPLTVHYCLAPDDGATGVPQGPAAPPLIEVVVLEVTNTPWHERHCYVVDARPCAGHRPPAGPVARGRLDGRGRLHAVLPKALHVSPFMGMDQTYHLTCSPPGERLWLRLESFEASGEEADDPVKVFDADLVLRREPLTRRSLRHRLCTHPLLTWRVWAAIHGHAARLAAARVPFVPHPDRAGIDRPRRWTSARRARGTR